MSRGEIRDQRSRKGEAQRCCVDRPQKQIYATFLTRSRDFRARVRIRVHSILTWFAILDCLGNSSRTYQCTDALLPDQKYMS